jgi:hypothetical protein
LPTARVRPPEKRETRPDVRSSTLGGPSEKCPNTLIIALLFPSLRTVSRTLQNPLDRGAILLGISDREVFQ